MVKAKSKPFAKGDRVVLQAATGNYYPQCYRDAGIPEPKPGTIQEIVRDRSNKPYAAMVKFDDAKKAERVLFINIKRQPNLFKKGR